MTTKRQMSFSSAVVNLLIIAVVPLYIVSCFISAEWNPMNWSEIGRFCFVVVSAVIWLYGYRAAKIDNLIKE